MGLKVPKQISDYPKFGLDVGIACDACGRIAVFKAGEVAAFFDIRKIPTTLPLNTRVFTCKCGSQKCRSIAVEISERPKPHEAYGKMLHPIYVIRRKAKR